MTSLIRYASLILFPSLVLIACHRDAVPPPQPVAPNRAEFAVVVSEAQCAVFGMVVSASNVDPNSLPIGIRSADSIDPFGAEAKLVISRIYGGDDCMLLADPKKHLTVYLHFDANSKRPTLGERSLLFCTPLQTGIATDAVPGLSYWPTMLSKGAWHVRFGPGLLEAGPTLEEALSSMERIELPLPQPEPPCGLNQAIVVRSREIVESGAPSPQ